MKNNVLEQMEGSLLLFEFDMKEVEQQDYKTSQFKKSVFLVGCYRHEDKNQLQWILGESTHRGIALYNVRTSKGRDGWVNENNPKVQNPEYLVLYEHGNPTNASARFFHIHSSEIKTEDEMKALNYPDPKGDYLVYSLDKEVSFVDFPLESIIRNFSERGNWVSGKPIYITGSEALATARTSKKSKSTAQSSMAKNSIFEDPAPAISVEEVVNNLNTSETFPDDAYTSIDLFSGCGGLTKGFAMAGVKSIFASDIDENCEKTFKRNFPGTPFICKDITTIEKAEVDALIGDNKPDIIIGGPPCQGFSLANKRRNKIADDPRNKLFYGFVKFINWYSPKAFVMENVKGLLSMQKGEVLETILNEFRNAGECGYNVEYKVLRASDYGVPQNRERVILIGFRKDLNIQPVHPEPYQLDHLVTVDEAIADLPQIEAGQGTDVMNYPSEPTNEYQRLMRANSQYVLNHVAMKHTPRLVERFKAIQPGQSLVDVWETHGSVKRGAPGEKSTVKFGQNNQRLHGNLPAPTIAASFQSNFIHPHLNRNFTAREGARLQSFPDDFVFEGMRTKMSWEKGLSQYQQIGNAVPVLLAKAIADSVTGQLDTIEK